VYVTADERLIGVSPDWRFDEEQLREFAGRIAFIVDMLRDDDGLEDPGDYFRYMPEDWFLTAVEDVDHPAKVREWHLFGCWPKQWKVN